MLNIRLNPASINILDATVLLIVGIALNFRWCTAGKGYDGTKDNDDLLDKGHCFLLVVIK
jgi:hypothetical protein